VSAGLGGNVSAGRRVGGSAWGKRIGVWALSQGRLRRRGNVSAYRRVGVQSKGK
jgi:hypothetical protein